MLSATFTGYVKYEFVYVHADNVCMVMPYYEHHDVEEYTKVKTVSSLEKLALLFKAGVILSYMHQQGFIHRDIKPQNMLLDKNLNVAIADLMTVTSIARTIRSTPGTEEYKTEAVKSWSAKNNQNELLPHDIAIENDKFAYAKSVQNIMLHELKNFPLVALCVEFVLLKPKALHMHTLVSCIGVTTNCETIDLPKLSISELLVLVEHCFTRCNTSSPLKDIAVGALTQYAELSVANALTILNNQDYADKVLNTVTSFDSLHKLVSTPASLRTCLIEQFGNHMADDFALKLFYLHVISMNNLYN